MSFGGLRDEADERFGPVARFFLRLVGSGAAAGAVAGVGMFGMLFMRAPAWVSLMFEPLSLLLLPGWLLSAWNTLSHEVRPHQVVEDSCVFYFVVIWLVAEARTRRGRG